MTIREISPTISSSSLEVGQLESMGPYSPQFDSTLSSSSNNTISGIKSVGRFFVSIFTFAISFVSFVFVLCTCCFRGRAKEQKIDWEETKDIFSNIYLAVGPERMYLIPAGEKTGRMKKFQSAYGELSEAAQDRFKCHIGFVLAQRNGSSSLPAQEAWYQTNRTSIQFQDYLGDLDNEILRQAVANFQAELEEKVASA